MAREKTDISGIYKNVLKNGDISWSIMKKVDGKGKYIPIGKKNANNIKTAKQALSFYLKNEQEIYDIFENIGREENHTLNEIVEEYYISRNQKADAEFCEKYNNLPYSKIISSVEYQKSMRDRKKIYKYAYKNHVKNKKLGNLKLCDISKVDINDFIRNDLGQAEEKKEFAKLIDFLKKNSIEEKNIKTSTDLKFKKQIKRYIELEKTIKTLSTKYIFNIMTYIKTAVNYSIDKYSLKIDNPFNNMKFKKGINKNLRVLDKEEIQKLLTHTKTIDLTMYLCAYLFVYTAGRPNTILNIKKSDFDLENEKINLYNFKLKRPYKLDLNQESIEFFKKILVDFEDEEYLIKSARKYKVERKQNEPLKDIPQRFQTILDKLFNKGFDKRSNPEKSISCYSLRRSIATNLILEGFPLFIAQTLLDHNSQKTTEIYLRIQKNDIKDKHNDYLKSIFQDITFT